MSRFCIETELSIWNQRLNIFILLAQPTDEGKDYWRQELITAIGDISSEYDTLLYGEKYRRLPCLL